MDTGRAPRRVLFCHADYEVTDLLCYSRSACSVPRPDTPEQAEPLAVPADDECKMMAGVDCEPVAVQDRLAHYQKLEKGMATKNKSIDAAPQTEEDAE